MYRSFFFNFFHGDGWPTDINFHLSADECDFDSSFRLWTVLYHRKSLTSQLNNCRTLGVSVYKRIKCNIVFDMHRILIGIVPHSYHICVRRLIKSPGKNINYYLQCRFGVFLWFFLFFIWSTPLKLLKQVSAKYA